MRQGLRVERITGRRTFHAPAPIIVAMRRSVPYALRCVATRPCVPDASSTLAAWSSEPAEDRRPRTPPCGFAARIDLLWIHPVVVAIRVAVAIWNAGEDEPEAGSTAV